MFYPASFATIDTSNGIVRQIVWPMWQGCLLRNVSLMQKSFWIQALFGAHSLPPDTWFIRQIHYSRHNPQTPHSCCASFMLQGMKYAVIYLWLLRKCTGMTLNAGCLKSEVVIGLWIFIVFASYPLEHMCLPSTSSILANSSLSCLITNYQLVCNGLVWYSDAQAIKIFSDHIMTQSGRFNMALR